MEHIEQPYLLVTNIPCHVDRGGRRYVDPLWHRDLVAHLDYIDDLVLAAPRVETQDAKEFLEMPQSIRYVPLPAPRSFLQSVLSIASCVVRLWNAAGCVQVVHVGIAGWPIPLGWLASPIARIRRKVLVIVVESAPWRILPHHRPSMMNRLRATVFERMAGWCSRLADVAFFTQSEYCRSMLGRHADRGHVVCASWVDPAHVISTDCAEREWGEKLRAQHAPLRLAYAGRLSADKGVRVLLEAIGRLDDAGVQINLDILGTGELLLECRRFIHDYNGSSCIRLCGTMPYGGPFFSRLRSYDALIVPSLADEQPRVVYDACSQAVPVIASDTVGLRECVADQMDGRLFPAGQAGALAQAIAWCDKNRNNLKNMGMAGLTKARKTTHVEMHRTRNRVIRAALPQTKTLHELLGGTGAASEGTMHLKDLLKEIMHNRGRLGHVTRLCASKPVADDTTKLLVRDASGRLAAVLICSSDVDPDLMARACETANGAKEWLGEELGQVVPTPLARGLLDGRTFVVWPYFAPLSSQRVVWAVQQRWVRPAVLSWLRAATAITCRQPSDAEIQRDFLAPLEHLAGERNRVLAQEAESAAGRLLVGHWTPKYVLAHNDFWKNNILLGHCRPGARELWTTLPPFVLIDWAGARLSGHPIYDLVRIAQSFSISRRKLRNEVERHCEILGCEPADAMSCLLSSLGYLGMHLAHFPKDRYLQLAESCHSSLRLAMQ